MPLVCSPIIIISKQKLIGSLPCWPIMWRLKHHSENVCLITYIGKAEARSFSWVVVEVKAIDVVVLGLEQGIVFLALETMSHN